MSKKDVEILEPEKNT